VSGSADAEGRMLGFEKILLTAVATCGLGCWSSGTADEENSDAGFATDTQDTDSDAGNDTASDTGTEIDTSCDGIVQIPDTDLLGAINYNLGRSKMNEPVTGADLAMLLDFYISFCVDPSDIEGNRRVKDLTGLQCMTALQSFNVECGAFTDIWPLGKITTLEGVMLSSDLVTDFSPLSDNPLLKALDASGGVLTDAGSLAALTTLDHLDLRGNKELVDISDLSGLAVLRNLDLSFSLISDVSPLSTLTNLETLDITDTQVTDISALASMSKLQTLTAGNLMLVDISAVGDLHALKTIDLSNNLIDNISVLATVDWPDLGLLDLSGNTIADLGPLVANEATFHSGVAVDLCSNFVDCADPQQAANVDALKARGVVLDFSCN
jgi:Leucine-rich repeat (LRR) protein